MSSVSKIFKSWIHIYGCTALECNLNFLSNQSILNEISSGCSLEGMMLKLKLQYFGHLMQRIDSLEKTDAGRDWGQQEKGMTEDEIAGWHH